MIKARVRGRRARRRGRSSTALLRPFVYRRYLDFGAIDSLRELKRLIAKELHRKGMDANIKLGPGRHPRDRVHRPGLPTGARRARPGPADPPHPPVLALPREPLACCPRTSVSQLDDGLPLPAPGGEPPPGVPGPADPCPPRRGPGPPAAGPLHGLRGLGGLRRRSSTATAHGSRRSSIRSSPPPARREADARRRGPPRPRPARIPGTGLERTALDARLHASLEPGPARPGRLPRPQGHPRRGSTPSARPAPARV